MLWVKRIEEGGLIPRGYGISYQDWRRLRAVCHPFGLHLLVRWAVRAYWRLAHFKRNTLRDRELSAARFAGTEEFCSCGRRINHRHRGAS